MNGHKLQSIKVQRVALIPHPSSDEPVLIYTGKEEQAVGCEICGASYEEVLIKPCPEEPRLVAIDGGLAVDDG